MATLINIDNGGTLTDVCVVRDGDVFHAKTLTTPYDLAECFVGAIREAAREMFGEPDVERLLRETDHLRYSTTEGTNRVVQRTGPRLGLILSAGESADSLAGAGAAAEMLEVLVGERVRNIETGADSDAVEPALVRAVNELMALGANRLVVAASGGEAAGDEARIKDIILRCYPRHLLGAVPVLFSTEMVNDAELARRAWTGLLNAFLHPGMERFLYNAENVLRQRHVRRPMLIYCNDGTSKRVAKTVALKTLGSGPRGGTEGARSLAQYYGLPRCVTLDVGGTTADIGVVDASGVAEARRGRVEDIPISLPIPEVHSIGAAGGSVVTVRDGAIVVGPESVGSTPGPACFARGGTQATVTDANLLLGLLDPDSYFGGSLRLDATRAEEAIRKHVAEPLGVSVGAALPRMIEAFEAAIAAGIERYAGDIAGATLLAYGGAGPMNACGVAQRLGIHGVVVPRLAAVFSAYGIGFSDIAHSYERPLGEVSEDSLESTRAAILEEAERGMFAEGYALEDCSLEWRVGYDEGEGGGTVRLNGGTPSLPAGAANPVLDLAVHKAIPGCRWAALDPGRERREAAPDHSRTLRLDGENDAEVPVYRVDALTPGGAGAGPALLEERYFTAYVPAGWSFVADENLNLNLSASGE